MGPKKISFAAMPGIAVRIIVAPADSFRKMPKKGGFLEPLVFAGVTGLTASIIHAILSLLGFGYGGQPQSGWAWILLSIIFIPIVLNVCTFIGAAIVFFFWKLIGSKQNYEVSYRCMAYLMAISPLIAIIAVVPYAGMVLSVVIVTFYIVIASAEVNGIPARRALLVFGIIGIAWIIGIGLTMLSLNSEYSVRNPTPEQVRKAANETALQYQRLVDKNKKQAEEARAQTVIK
ncbi:MAG: YIP1 family protein [Deltaproteobacteria bacterium]